MSLLNFQQVILARCGNTVMQKHYALKKLSRDPFNQENLC
jgi:hypothetical protein